MKKLYTILSLFLLISFPTISFASWHAHPSSNYTISSAGIFSSTDTWTPGHTCTYSYNLPNSWGTGPVSSGYPSCTTYNLTTAYWNTSFVNNCPYHLSHDIDTSVNAIEIELTDNTNGADKTYYPITCSNGVWSSLPTCSSLTNATDCGVRFDCYWADSACVLNTNPISPPSLPTPTIPTLETACNSLTTSSDCAIEPLSCYWTGTKCSATAFTPSTSSAFNTFQALLITKIPFAYLYAIENMWALGMTSLTTLDYPKITMPNPFPGHGSDDLTLLDLSATRDLMGHSQFDLFRTICGYLFWLSGFFFHLGNITQT